MKLLDATADGAGAASPFGSGEGGSGLLELAASNLRVVQSLMRSLGRTHGIGVAAHVLRQTLRTARSSTAYQTYWTGVVETGGIPGKFKIEPVTDENDRRPLSPGERHLTRDWRERQASGPMIFNLHWLPFIKEEVTPLIELSETWEERPHLVGQVTFPKADGGEEAVLWAELAAEMGANPGNWVCDAENSIVEPGTEFTCACKIAYRKSQTGRNDLPEDAYSHVFESGEIDRTLAEELRRRRAEKSRMRHLDRAP